MKNAEDEAFDELARKQGDWGGGFPAKRAMAKARIDDDDDDTQVYQSQSQFFKQFETPTPLYINGWNAALDEAAARISKFGGFGHATQDSFAVFIKGLKK